MRDMIVLRVNIIVDRMNEVSKAISRRTTRRYFRQERSEGYYFGESSEWCKIRRLDWKMIYSSYAFPVFYSCLNIFALTWSEHPALLANVQSHEECCLWRLPGSLIAGLRR